MSCSRFRRSPTEWFVPFPKIRVQFSEKCSKKKFFFGKKLKVKNSFNFSFFILLEIQIRENRGNYRQKFSIEIFYFKESFLKNWMYSKIKKCNGPFKMEILKDLIQLLFLRNGGEKRGKATSLSAREPNIRL